MKLLLFAITIFFLSACSGSTEGDTTNVSDTLTDTPQLEQQADTTISHIDSIGDSLERIQNKAQEDAALDRQNN